MHTFTGVCGYILVRDSYLVLKLMLMGDTIFPFLHNYTVYPDLRNVYGSLIDYYL